MHNNFFKFKVFLFLIFAAFAVLITPLCAAVEQKRAYFPPVLMYHDIKITPLNAFDVTLDDFCKQLDWLQANGYETLSTEEFIAYVNQGKDFPENAVLITFDDGYQGIYKYAVPELKKRSMKATFFIIADVIGKYNEAYPHATKEEISEIANDGLFSIGSHTRTHPHLDKITEEERVKELAEAKKALEDLFNVQVNALAYPYGDYDKAVIESAKAAGYDVAFAVQDRGLLDEPARYSIPRIYVGVALGKDDQRFFKEYVKDYKNMPPEAFVERWSPLPE